MTTSHRVYVFGIGVVLACGYYALDHRYIPDRHVFAQASASSTDTPTPTPTPDVATPTPDATPTPALKQHHLRHVRSADSRGKS